MTRAQPLAVAGAALALLVLSTSGLSAEWQVKPFIGGTYGGDSTFAIAGPLTQPPFPNHPHFAYGVSGLLIGEIFGVEADFSHTPGFFQADSAPLVMESGVYVLTGNVVVAMPRRLTQYTLRPYLVGGAGLMHVSFDTTQGALPVSERLQAMDLGAGVTGFVTRRIGVSWDVRYFRSIERTIQSGISLGPERLSFWRASMAVAVRI
jgi:hypothetical protein